jgi:ABC-2 type transport system ATP-binding protein
LTIDENKIIGIIGRNGSGKTVLLKIISGLYFKDTGYIEYNEKYTINNDYGILIDSGFLENETGFENLKNLALLRNKITDNDIIDVIKWVGLDPFDKTKYKNYSIGMKQKLKIAQAVMEKPKVLILDEPFNGLDQKSVDYFRNEIIKLKKEGLTLIITSHYKEDIEKLCDIVYEMNEGKIKLHEMDKK